MEGGKEEKPLLVLLEKLKRASCFQIKYTTEEEKNPQLIHHISASVEPVGKNHHNNALLFKWL